MKPLKLISLLAAFAVILVLTLSLIGCGNPNPSGQRTSTVVDLNSTEYRVQGNNLLERNVKLVVIDGCEYLYGPWGNATVLTHKGNCTNPIHPEHTRR